MKKRLLALALCLAMMTSLLPLTAAAYTDADVVNWVNGITDNGMYCGDTYFTISCPDPDDVVIREVVWSTTSGEDTKIIYPVDPVKYKVPAASGTGSVKIYFLLNAVYPLKFVAANITINANHTWSPWKSNGDGTHSRTCSNGCVDSPQTASCADTSPADCKCDDCGASMHTWQFTRTDSTLTGTCQKSTCPIKEVSVSLKADSVTLPNSPFNARLEGWNDFQAATGAEKTDIVYKCNGVEVSDGSTPKAGNYQAWVMIKNLRGPVYQDGVAAFADSQDTTSTAELFVQYTAVDPAVTAQTGDNRPIELMMMGVVLFSALAAAAFILDNKRKYSR